jgi:ABC-2 type transport system ATP-binding protein
MAGEQQLAIETSGLRKRYGKVVALDGVDLRVESGIVFGLLGPNGAGKTTAVRILTTLLHPDEGSASVAGIDVLRHPGQVRERIGLAGQYAAVDDNLTGAENLEMVGRLYHLGGGKARERARELLDEFELSYAGGRLVRTYSGGMRRRLDLAAAMVARPAVLFLDEPTTGIDPRSRIALWGTIEGLVAHGATVLLTTQYLDEADRLAEQLAVIDAGRVIAEGTPAELKAASGGERLEVQLSDPSSLDAASRALAPLSSDGPVRADGLLLSLPLRTRAGAVAEAVRRLDEAGVAVEDLAVVTPTLDDVFLQLTGHVAEEREELE